MDVSKTAPIIVSSCPRLFQDCINIFPGFRLAQLVQKIAEALLDGDVDTRFIGEIQIPERLEHVIFINGFYFHIRHLSTLKRIK